MVQVTPMGSPASDETKDLVDALRAKADEVESETGIEAYVTGTTALNIDTSDTLAAALPLYVAVVVGLALVLLMIVFRSILVPVKAVAGFLLTIAAAMGLTVWIFQDGNLADLFGVALPGPIVSFLPVLMIGILFGLAMDYEVFLVSGMREEYTRTGRATESVIKGYGHSGRVVVAAALIMIGVFGAYVLDPDPVVKSIGVSLAFGVFADAFIVRLTLVPAAMALLGKRAWGLPKRLERSCPRSTSRARASMSTRSRRRCRGSCRQWMTAGPAMPGPRSYWDRGSPDPLSSLNLLISVVASARPPGVLAQLSAGGSGDVSDHGFESARLTRHLIGIPDLSIEEAPTGLGHGY